MTAAYGKDQVLKIVNSVLEKVSQNSDASSEVIYKELFELKTIIDAAKQDIGLARPSDITDTHIPTATDELDAVIEATAEATSHIMDACEAIEEKASGIGGSTADEINGEVTKIYEACSFQDITGQRITKVVGALRDIEIKVNALLGVFEHQLPGGTAEAVDEDGDKGDGLLNGPQLPNKGVTQDDIDKLLADFD